MKGKPNSRNLTINYNHLLSEHLHALKYFMLNLSEKKDSLQQPNFQPFNLIMIHSVEFLRVITGQGQKTRAKRFELDYGS